MRVKRGNSINRYYPDWEYIEIGINEEVIRRYAQSQEEEETGQAKLEF